jgi:hypothetical protein
LCDACCERYQLQPVNTALRYIYSGCLRVSSIHSFRPDWDRSPYSNDSRWAKRS